MNGQSNIETEKTAAFIVCEECYSEAISEATKMVPFFDIQSAEYVYLWWHTNRKASKYTRIDYSVPITDNDTLVEYTSRSLIIPNTEQQQHMDDAANEAEQDLESLSNDVVQPMAQWFQKWYLRAGHKRLSKIMVNIARNASR
ncbi:hypothetical protein ACFLTP_02840 [Chloroflexota bacterium]